MSEVTIRTLTNGPLLVEGPISLVDSDGNQFPTPAEKKSIAICRCANSANQPFCDGSHKSCGFESNVKAPA